jgi:KaiC/GvpD/RAD55 family RecA-like ATPase
VLDYPLDILLDRECELTAYERGLYQELRALHDAIVRVLCAGPAAAAAALRAKENLERDCKKRTATSEDQESVFGHSAPGVNDLVQIYTQRLRSLLFDRDGKEPKSTAFGGLRLSSGEDSHIDTDPSESATPAPEFANAPTGNILIRGRPGTCKSTLALQLATMCTVSPNYYLSLFVCLEETPDRVRAKCAEMRWDGQFVELRNLTRLDAASSSEEIAQALDEILRPRCLSTSKEKAGFPLPRVLMPILSPRSLHAAQAGATETFQTRYEQLERLLRGFRWLRSPGLAKREFPLPELRMVCIDSLSALAERPLTREELFRVFDLFTHYGVVGVATAEDQSEENADAMDYLADVVIDLRAEEDAGYATRYIEIKKARHQHQVYGLHPFGVRNYQEINADVDSPADVDAAFQAIMIYPSIHHTVASTRQNPPRNPEQQKVDLFDIGVASLGNVLTNRLPRGSIVAVNGPRGTFKSHIAHNFLLSGIVNGESALLVHLGEQEQFCPSMWTGDSNSVGDSWLVSRDLVSQFNDYRKRVGLPQVEKSACRERLWEQFTLAGDKQAGLGVEHKNTAKFARKVWRFGGVEKVPARGKRPLPVLVELDLKPGALLPEQFIKLVRDIFRQLDTYRDKRKAAEIRRIVLDDVSLIGTSYPFLRQSKTAGDLFLSAFAHMCRAYNIDLVTLGTSGEFNEADGVVKRAATLADSVLTCNYCDVFGARFIAVTGEGLMVGSQRDPDNRQRPVYGEYVPGVIAAERGGVFDVNLELLEGLVGFEQGRVHRPGLVVSVFSEGSILGRYNAEIRTMLERAFASPSSGRVGAESGLSRIPDADISVMEFDSGKSGPLHQSLDVLRGKPIDKTVVCALDEFFLGPNAAGFTTPTDAATPGVLGQRLPGPSSATLTDVLCDLTSVTHDVVSKFRKELWPDNKYPKTVVAVPYYSNLLVLAYRADVLGSTLERTIRRDSGRTWSILANAIEKGNHSTFWGFECGAWSRETLACVVLDLLLSPTDLPVPRSVRKVIEGACAGRRLKSLSAEFSALRRLFRNSMRIDHGLFPAGPQTDPGPHQKEESTRLPPSLPSGRGLRPRALMREIEAYSQKLVGNAAIYLGWYSQLRELIDEHPEVGPNLKVIALPGGGIRGDWYLGVVKGSVSVKLGLNIIKILANENEDSRRFIRGVGLPVLGKRSDGTPVDMKSRMAWYRGQVPLSAVLKIHKNARSRSRFSDYQGCRETLAALGEQIAFTVDCDRESIEALLSRASRIIRSSGPEDPPPSGGQASRQSGHR